MRNIYVVVQKLPDINLYYFKSDIPDSPWTSISISMDFLTDIPKKKIKWIHLYTHLLIYWPPHLKKKKKKKKKWVTPFPIFKRSFYYRYSLFFFFFYSFFLFSFSSPSTINSDRGYSLNSLQNFFGSLSAKVIISLKFPVFFTPSDRTNGLTERMNSVIEQYLRCYVNSKQIQLGWFPFT